MGRGRRRNLSRTGNGSSEGFWRRWLVPMIGAITPVGLIIVNIAAFIVHHLQGFRLIIAVLAFISGLMLNSWTALRVFQVLRTRAPDHGLVQERNQELVIIGGMAIVIVGAGATAWFCYQGLASDSNLPNPITFITGVVAVLIPVGIREFSNRILRRREGNNAILNDSLPGYSPRRP